MKLCLLLIILTLSGFASADPSSYMPMSVKDRLRIHLWVEGLEIEQEAPKDIKRPVQLPEEIVKALDKF